MALRFLRSIIFDGVFYLVTGCLCIVCLPVLLGPRRWTVLLSQMWCRWSLWWLKMIVGLNFNVQGELPKGPFILAAKHESAWETLALTLLTPDPAFVLKDVLLWIPLFGWYLKKAGMVPVQRKGNRKMINPMLERARQITQQGRPIILFPEGTRTPPGSSPTLKSGVWYLHDALNVPIVPVSLNSGYFWGRKAWVKKPGTINVIIHPPVKDFKRSKRDFLHSLQATINVQNVS